MNQSKRNCHARRISILMTSQLPYPTWAIMHTRKRSSSSVKALALPVEGPYGMVRVWYGFLWRATFSASARSMATRR